MRTMRTMRTILSHFQRPFQSGMLDWMVRPTCLKLGLEISGDRYLTQNETVKRFHEKTLPFAQEPAAPGGS
jgi:hypothetical protein